ncbi:spore coat protein CotH [Bacillus aquiflavi]|uniref:Spore coat protein CotH n=1 Tax=Bacillus aquiflavi TaxID=2672567 RepID=A0A6B3VR94_9BACI|nr:spore coat protein [Bacillus aquiflavi]MBA4536125.1 spore coat protein CotH [Bacillus aquiflavi]NEY80499.1 spore coat protein CotH [Bacillus aquiflavi]UAC47035.1 spore coat protein [Bacillus aquiflavi]
MYCGPNVMPAIVHPTKCCMNHTFSKSIVPHIHPTHTTTVNHHLYEHQHYFPHSYSAANEVSNQHLSCGAGPGPRPRPPYWG